MNPAPGETPIEVGTMYGYKSHAPIVTLRWGDRMPYQLTTAKAREIALLLLEAAESAEQDGFIHDWVTTRLHATDVAAAQVLGEFRTWRQEQQAKAEHP